VDRGEIVNGDGVDACGDRLVDHFDCEARPDVPTKTFGGPANDVAQEPTATTLTGFWPRLSGGLMTWAVSGVYGMP
jgi:hypothetical protein